MIKNNNYKILFPLFFMILIFTNCSNDKGSQTSKKTRLHDTSKGSSLELIKYNKEEHPCLKAGHINSVGIYNKAVYSKSSETSQYYEIDIYKYLIDSAMRFNHYSEFMRVLNNNIHRKEIDDYHNPKYYFLRAIELIRVKDYAIAKDNITSFLLAKDNYLKNKNAYWDFDGCREHDIDWILSLEDSRIFHLARLLDRYLDKMINQEFIDYNNLFKDLQVYDNDPEVLDLVDNIIFGIMISSDFEYDKIKSFVYKSRGVLTSGFNELYNDGMEYYLSTQIEILSYIKYLESIQYFNNLDWNKIEENINTFGARLPYPEYNFSIGHLYSMMRYYEYKYDILGDRSNSDLFDKIKRIINYEICEEEECEYFIQDKSRFDLWLDYYRVDDAIVKNQLVKKMKNFNINIKEKKYDVHELLNRLDEFNISSEIDSSGYFIISHLLVNSHLFHSIATDSIGWNIHIPNKKYFSIIKNFTSKSSNYDQNLNIDHLIKDNTQFFYTMYNIDSPVAIELIEDFSEQATPRIKNEGINPLLQSWKFLQAYFPKK